MPWSPPSPTGPNHPCPVPLEGAHRGPTYHLADRHGRWNLVGLLHGLPDRPVPRAQGWRRPRRPRPLLRTRCPPRPAPVGLTRGPPRAPVRRRDPEPHPWTDAPPTATPITPTTRSLHAPPRPVLTVPTPPTR